eukprot:6610938-Lingulodinium_polyedra.AAC.1
MVLSAAHNRMEEGAIVTALRRLGPLLEGAVAIGRSEHEARPAVPWGGAKRDKEPEPRGAPGLTGPAR